MRCRTLMGIKLPEVWLDARPGIKTALESGEIEGIPFRVLEGDIEAGDTYIAERRGGMRLLTCRENNKEQRWIVPVEQAYTYNTGDCVRIELILD